MSIQLCRHSYLEVMMKNCILGMDVGGTHIRIGLVNDQEKAEHVEVFPSKNVWASDNAVKGLANLIKAYLNKYKDECIVHIITIGFPSLVDRTRTKLLSSTNFPGLDEVNIVASLEESLSVKVYIDHDAYYLLAYDIADHGLKNEGTMAGFYFGTGLGNAVFINGFPYYGKNGAACELGHIPIPFNHFPCSCGNEGCIEMFSCGKALERIWKKRFSNEKVGDIFKKYGTSEELLTFVEYISCAVASEVNILDPDVIFLGGGIIQMEGFPRHRLVERIVAHCRKPYPANCLDVRFQRPGAENGIIGGSICVKAQSK